MEMIELTKNFMLANLIHFLFAW